MIKRSNERIKQLMDQAGIDVETVENLGELPTALKFAHLIIDACVKIAHETDYILADHETVTVETKIEKHFGV